MPRDSRAYLVDIIEACDAIRSALTGLTLDTYRTNRTIRSSVEREFIIIGEAMAALSRHAPHIFESITGSRRVVDFRNRLTHEYATLDDALVWAVADRDVPLLHDECKVWIEKAGSSEDAH
jgi:uncharacterized protein with HEPN domain